MMFSDSSTRFNFSILIHYCILSTDWSGYIHVMVHNLQSQICLIFHLQTNASNDGEYVFFTGQQDYKDFARVDTWNGER